MKPTTKAVVVGLALTLIVFSVFVAIGWQEYKTKWEKDNNSQDAGTCNVGYADNYYPIEINSSWQP